MKPETDGAVNRRTWLADWVRYTLLGGVTVATGTLIGRGQVCGCSHPARACGACREWTRCELPQAVDAREQLARRETD